MRTKKDLVLRPLGDQFILVAEGNAVADFTQMVSMNASSAYLWDAVEGKDFELAIGLRPAFFMRWHSKCCSSCLPVFTWQFFARLLQWLHAACVMLESVRGLCSCPLPCALHRPLFSWMPDWRECRPCSRPYLSSGKWSYTR